MSVLAIAPALAGMWPTRDQKAHQPADFPAADGVTVVQYFNSIHLRCSAKRSANRSMKVLTLAETW